MHDKEATQSAGNSVPNVWLARGGRKGDRVEVSVSNGYAGIYFGLSNIDLSRVESETELKDFYLRENPQIAPATAGWSIKQISWFVFDIKIGDSVIMPEKPGTRVVHYGRIRSDVYHATDDDGLPRNRRKVVWKGKFKREDKPALHSLLKRRETVWLADDKEKLAFFEVLLGW